MSISKAYRRTIASFHALQAEREHRIRYAVLEARALGADFGPTETERGFLKESQQLDKWIATSAMEGSAAQTENTSAPTTRSVRVKRKDTAFTGGARYLAAAEVTSRGEDASFGSDGAAAPQKNDATSAPQDDYMGLKSALR